MSLGQRPAEDAGVRPAAAADLVVQRSPTFEARVLLRLPRIAVLFIGASAATAAVTFFVAGWLGPVDYGQAQVVLLAYMVAGLVQLGFFTAALRSSMHHRGTDNQEVALRDQNVGITYEFLASLIPGFALLCAVPFAHGTIEEIGFLLAPVVVGTSSFAGFLGGIEISYDRVEREAIASFAGAITAAGLAVLGVLAVGAYGLFVAPVFGYAVMIGVLFPRLWRQGLRPDFSWDRAKPLLRAGLPFAGLGIVYWLYRWTGPIAVSIGFGATALAYYSIANAPISLAIGTMSLAARVIMPSLWGHMARGHDRKWVVEGDRVTSALMIIAGLAATAGQTLFPWFIHLALPHYRQSVAVFEILALEIPLYAVALIPALTLDSIKVNRQRIQLIIASSALGLNIVANVAVVAGGLELLAIAWVDVAAQLLVMVGTFVVARPAQGPLHLRIRALSSGLVGMAATYLVGAAMVAVTFWSTSPGNGQLGLRLMIFAVGWGTAALILLGRGRWLPLEMSGGEEGARRF